MRTLKISLCGAFVLASWLIVTPAFADWPNASPIHLDWKFDVHFDVRLGQQHQNLGPWYAYFPVQAQSGNFGPYPGVASGWGIQAPLRGAGPLPPPSHALGSYGLPPSYWYKAR
jgi:hypothetical protein